MPFIRQYTLFQKLRILAVAFQHFRVVIAFQYHEIAAGNRFHYGRRNFSYVGNYGNAFPARRQSVSYARNVVTRPERRYGKFSHEKILHIEKNEVIRVFPACGGHSRLRIRACIHGRRILFVQRIKRFDVIGMFVRDQNGQIIAADVYAECRKRLFYPTKRKTRVYQNMGISVPNIYAVAFTSAAKHT